MLVEEGISSAVLVGLCDVGVDDGVVEEGVSEVEVAVAETELDVVVGVAVAVGTLLVGLGSRLLVWVLLLTTMSSSSTSIIVSCCDSMERGLRARRKDLEEREIITNRLL